VDDFETEWRYSKPFDYIHGREIAGAIKDFDKLVLQAFTHLKPGRFLELQFLRVKLYADDDSLEKAPYMVQLTHKVQEASITSSKRLNNMDECPEKMIKAGFTDVTCKIVKVPITPWPKDPKQKEIRKYMPQATTSYSYALLSRVTGWKREEIEDLLAHVRKELKNPAVHAYLKLYLVYGKKL
jgi:Methyltransferase domain